jgi:hypothetical protein
MAFPVSVPEIVTSLQEKEFMISITPRKFLSGTSAHVTFFPVL